MITRQNLREELESIAEVVNLQTRLSESRINNGLFYILLLIVLSNVICTIGILYNTNKIEIQKHASPRPTISTDR